MMPWLLVTVGLPTLAQGYVLGLLSLALGISQRPRFHGPVLTTMWRPWVERFWKYSTTLGGWMALASWANADTVYHEAVHVRQYVDENAKALVVGAALTPWIGWQGMLILWASSGALWLLPNFLTGWIRFGDPYMGSEHERSAYAQARVASGG